jgi:hypothetical protein
VLLEANGYSAVDASNSSKLCQITKLEMFLQDFPQVTRKKHALLLVLRGAFADEQHFPPLNACADRCAADGCTVLLQRPY